MSDIEKAKEMLSEGYTLAFICGEESYTSRERGVSPLIKIIDTGADYSAYSAADKVVGRGGALLYVLIGIKRVHASVISRSALSVFSEYRVTASYDTLVERIENRDKTGFCPIEEATLGINSPAEALAAIKEALLSLKKKEVKNEAL